MTVGQLIEVLQAWPDKETPIYVDCSTDSFDHYFAPMDAIEHLVVDEEGFQVDSSDEGSATDLEALVIFPV